MKDESELPPAEPVSDLPQEPIGSEFPKRRVPYLSAAAEVFLALPRKLQLAAVATLATVLGSVFGVDTAVLRYLFAPEPVVVQAPAELPARKCESPGALDAERADLEALGK